MKAHSFPYVSGAVSKKAKKICSKKKRNKEKNKKSEKTNMPLRLSWIAIINCNMSAVLQQLACRPSIHSHKVGKPVGHSLLQENPGCTIAGIIFL